MLLKTLAFSSLLISAANAATLTTLPANNGTGGIFLSLTPVTSTIQLTGFTAYLGSSTAGTPAEIEIWARVGSYAGFTASNAGWTLLETVTGIAAGTSTESAAINFGTPIELPFGQTTSLYFHSITPGNGIRYQGTGTTSTSTFSNADISLFSDVSRTGTEPFAGNQFTPRAFAGTIIYTVPEPSTTLILGISLIGLARRRRVS
jgi:hypothetical protein